MCFWKGKQKDDTDKRSFLKLSIANKVLNAINLGNTFHIKSVKSIIPLYFIVQSVLIISFAYSIHNATKLLNTNTHCSISTLTTSI